MRAFLLWIERNLTVILVLILALILRIYGNGFGLPDQLNIDEVHVVSRAIKFGSGDLNPHFFFYPALYMYFLFACYAVYFVIGRIAGIFPSASDFGMQYFIDPTMFYIIARTVTALIGAATVYTVAAIGTRFYNRRVGIAAALLLAAAPLHVEMSHVATTDVAMVFLAAVSIFFAIRASECGERRYYLAAGFFGGLAMAAKYTAVLIVPALIASHVVYSFSGGGKGKLTKHFSFNIIATGFVFAAGFLIGAPYSLIDYKTFLGDIKIQGELISYGWFGLEEPVNMWLHSITNFLKNGMGLPLLITACAGFVYAVAKRKKADIIILVFLIVFYLYHGRLSNFSFARYWVTVIPFLCIFAAAFIDWAAAVVKIPERKRYEVVALTALALMVLPVKSILKSEDVASHKDNRTLAREWIENTIPAGAKIAVEMGGPQLKSTPESLMDKERIMRFAARHVDEAVTFYAYKKRKPVAVEAGSQKRFHRAALKKIKKKYDVFQTFALAEYPLDLYEKEGFDYLVADGHIYKRYYAAARHYPKAVAFYINLDRNAVLVKEFPEALSVRPGPEIRIYKLKR